MKKVLAIVLVIFVVFFIFTQPQAAADVVRAIVGVIGDAFDTMIRFLNALFT